MKSKGFTLIELLIVIAIILILIAIALPNFLEAQIRARVTKAKGEIRSLGIAMESYFLDWKIYPAESEHDILTNFSRGRFESGLKWLTSPIKYISSIPEDPFPGTDQDIITYETGGVEFAGTLVDRKFLNCMVTWAMFSRGPHSVSGNPNEAISSADPNVGIVTTYSPTNGTSSVGAIYLYGGDSFFIGVPISTANYAAARTMTPSPLMVDGVPFVHRLPPPLK
ncbi:MAG: prepilin-type N-terminal cleavage/methylation domain-containing protein [Candidatus Omnitrophica bacterium]|nr:prepilin-type N-terminal cleavage/methylation domain-containing protein [Candidatus Omnitrophota bacterium]